MRERPLTTIYGDLVDYNAEMLYAMNVEASIATSFTEYAAVRNHLVHQWMQAFDKHWLPPKNYGCKAASGRVN